jgi:stage III sporulation protein AE
VDSIRNASLFMLGYIPVFSAAVVAAGQPVTGATYNTVLFAACQIVSQVISQTLLPLLSVYLALCIVGSLSPGLDIGSVCATVKRVVTWGLGFLATLFIGILSVQTMVSGSADALGLKAGKFVISSFVPVVGSALSDALVAAQGCLRLIRTTVGAFGILAVLLLFLPILLQIISWLLVTALARAAAELLGVKEVSGVMKSCSGVLSILISFLLCYALVMIVAITVVLFTGMGGG